MPLSFGYLYKLDVLFLFFFFLKNQKRIDKGKIQ